MPGTKCEFNSLRCNVPCPDGRVWMLPPCPLYYLCLVCYRKLRLDPICLDTLRPDGEDTHPEGRCRGTRRPDNICLDTLHPEGKCPDSPHPEGRCHGARGRYNICMTLCIRKKFALTFCIYKTRTAFRRQMP